jgi:hypothetical protein
MNLILMDPCIVDYSVEIPTRCSFVIELIIPKFIEGSTCFERHTGPLSLGNGRSPYGNINQRLQIQFCAPDDERRAAQNMFSL